MLTSFNAVLPDSPFPIQNLPFGIFKPKDGAARVGIAIGDQVLDLSLLEARGHFAPAGFGKDPIFAHDSLNAFLKLGRPAWKKTREIVQRLLAADNAELRDDPPLRAAVFHAQKHVIMQFPARIGEYTDFYSSYHHPPTSVNMLSWRAHA